MAQTFQRTINSKLEQQVRNHIKNVYACLSMSVITAGIGAYVHMFTTLLPTELSFVGTIGCLTALLATSDENGKNRRMRLGFLLGYAFCMGHSMGPLLSVALNIDPCIITTALVASTLIFVSFTLSALLASRGSFLYLGELALAGLITVFLLSIMDIFIDTYLIEDTMLYLGLVVMFMYVLYDTQLIIEKRLQGDTDFVAHSLDLFLDFIGILRRLLILCLQKDEKKRNRRR